MKRRTFLKHAAASSALVSLAPCVHSSGVNATPKVGLIGSGWYGKCDTLQLLNVAAVEVVSVCDVDSKMASVAAELLGSRQKSKQVPKVYEDYRKQLESDQHDIVIIGTPDHWHSLPMIAAVESGADV